MMASAPHQSSGDGGDAIVHQESLNPPLEEVFFPESSFIGLEEMIPGSYGGGGGGGGNGHSHDSSFSFLGGDLLSPPPLEDTSEAMQAQIELSQRLLGIAHASPMDNEQYAHRRPKATPSLAKAEALKELLEVGSDDPNVAAAKEKAREHLLATALADVQANRTNESMRASADSALLPPPPSSSMRTAARSPPRATPAATRASASFVSFEGEQMRNQLADMRDAVAVAQSRALEQQRRAESAETRLEDANARIVELEKVAQLAEQRLLAAESATSTAQASARTQKREAEGATATSARAVADAGQMRAQLADMRTQAEHYRRRYEDSEAARQAAVAAIEARASGEADAKKRLARAEHELAESRDTIGHAKVQIADLSRALERTEAIAAQARKVEAVHKTRAGSLEIELEKVQARISHMREEKEDLYAQLKSMQNAVLYFQGQPQQQHHQPLPPQPPPPPSQPAQQTNTFELAEMYRQRAEEQEARLRRLEERVSERPMAPAAAELARAQFLHETSDLAAEMEASLPPPRRDFVPPAPAPAPAPAPVSGQLDWEGLLPARVEDLPPAGMPSAFHSTNGGEPSLAEMAARRSRAEERPAAGAPTARDMTEPPLGLGAAAALGATMPARPTTAPPSRVHATTMDGAAAHSTTSHLPYATEASIAESLQRTAGLENELMRLSVERDTLTSQLNKIGPTSGRTLAERRLKADGERRLEEVSREIAQTRFALRRANGGQF
ncbi:hypothetical protein RI054_11g55680 [Pseudoscourfieldia marina]